MADLFNQTQVSTLSNSDRVAAGRPGQTGCKNIKYEDLFAQLSQEVGSDRTQQLVGTSQTLNCAESPNAKSTLTGDTTITLSNLADGMTGNIKVVQDSTGGHTLTLSPTPKVINGGAGVVELTGTANSVDIISWWFDGDDLNVTYGLNYD